MNIQNPKQVGDIVKFKAGPANAAIAGLANNLLCNKRKNIWNDQYILKDQAGIILEVRSIENTIKLEYQYWHKERTKDWIPYLWYCFKTAKIYLIYQCEMK